VLPGVKKKLPLYIAAVDASAGCMDALQGVLSHLPLDMDNVAFIITQTQKQSCKRTITDHLLKDNRLKVTEVKNGMILKEKNIYLVPAEQEVTIRKRKLFLSKSRKSGKMVPADGNLSISVDKELPAEAIGLILPGSGAELSEIIRLKEEQKMKEALDQRHKLFTSIARNFPDGIIGVLDKEFHYVFAGGTEIKKMGTTPEKLIGDNIFDHLSEKSNKAALPYLKKAFAGEDIAFEIEMKDQVYAINAVPLLEAGNEIVQILVVLHNITKRRRVEDDLHEALKKEKELSELKTRFVSMASHEFRTPLSTILSSAYLIGKYTGADDQPKREKHLQRVISSVTMLTDILNDFLSLGKIEEGQIQVRPSAFNLRDWVGEISGEMGSSLKKEQQIHYVHKGNTEVYMDASLLKHIVMNLLSNASKFSSEGSPIELNTTVRSGHIILSIKDYGIGIPKEDQKHLMERFFRGANAANIQGTGLGLHIVSRYSELMNGKVECRSELEKGTEFIIDFKIKKGRS